MHRNTFSLTEAKFLLNTSVSESDLLLCTLYDLLALNAIKIRNNDSKTASKRERYIVCKGPKFHEFTDGFYKNFHTSVLEYEESIIQPDRIREPLLTPYQLIDKVSIKSNKSYRKVVASWLKENNYIKYGFLPWRKFELTEEGAKGKSQLLDRLSEFEKTLKENNPQRNDYLTELIIELGPLVFLTEKLDKSILADMKDEISKSAPAIVDTQFGTLLDLYIIIEFDYYNLGFDGFDLLNE